MRSHLPRTRRTGTVFGLVAVGTAGAVSLSLTGAFAAPTSPPTPVQHHGPAVRVNQVGYVPGEPMIATVQTASKTPLAWTILRDTQVGNGGYQTTDVIATGRTTVHGDDAMSGQTVQEINFTPAHLSSGGSYRIQVGRELSYPFTVSTKLYQRVSHDALEFFYNESSGRPIEARFVGPQYARPAGHLGEGVNKGDVRVPCAPGTCNYSLDVRGGWYDAGDQGKYVVNGGVSVWNLLDQYERSRYAANGRASLMGDGSQDIPQQHNNVPDVLDQARWELEFMLRMQVPAGHKLAGMVHHKVADAQWTPLPTQPQNDPQQRYLFPPSTAATLNLAATAAQCARIWRKYDAQFAKHCRTSAETAWQAAVAHPAIYAPNSGTGSGAYNDDNVTDEFYWAAAELYITTGKKMYRDYLMSSPWYYGKGFTDDGYSWGTTAALGDLSLSEVPNKLPGSQLKLIDASVTKAADTYVAREKRQGYPNPYLPSSGNYEWGSNSGTLDTLVVVGHAYDLTGRAGYRRAVFNGLNYIFGQNALNQSYVTDWGTKYSKNEHSRIWARELDPTLPHPPPGTMAGGPASGTMDPVAAQYLQGCAPQTCYIDDIGSYSTNEEAINWNSPLSWVTAWANGEAQS